MNARQIPREEYFQTCSSGGITLLETIVTSRRSKNGFRQGEIVAQPTPAGSDFRFPPGGFWSLAFRGTVGYHVSCSGRRCRIFSLWATIPLTSSRDTICLSSEEYMRHVSSRATFCFFVLLKDDAESFRLGGNFLCFLWRKTFVCPPSIFSFFLRSISCINPLKVYNPFLNPVEDCFSSEQ